MRSSEVRRPSGPRATSSSGPGSISLISRSRRRADARAGWRALRAGTRCGSRAARAWARRTATRRRARRSRARGGTPGRAGTAGPRRWPRAPHVRRTPDAATAAGGTRRRRRRAGRVVLAQRGRQQRIGEEPLGEVVEQRRDTAGVEQERVAGVGDQRDDLLVAAQEREVVAVEPQVQRPRSIASGRSPGTIIWRSVVASGNRRLVAWVWRNTHSAVGRPAAMSRRVARIWPSTRSRWSGGRTSSRQVGSQKKPWSSPSTSSTPPSSRRRSIRSALT